MSALWTAIIWEALYATAVREFMPWARRPMSRVAFLVWASSDENRLAVLKAMS